MAFILYDLTTGEVLAGRGQNTFTAADKDGRGLVQKANPGPPPAGRKWKIDVNDPSGLWLTEIDYGADFQIEKFATYYTISVNGFSVRFPQNGDLTSRDFKVLRVMKNLLGD